MALALARGEPLGPASWVTLARATLAVGVAALVADSFAHDTPVALLVTLATVALALDAVDGRVARRTGTESALGARFDGETDAFLIAALSVYAAPEYGGWVLAIGAARYVFGAGEWLLPWMRKPLPPRRWRKVVAATQGIVLTIAAAEVLPRAVTQALLAVALALLMVSMVECTWWLWRRRDQAPDGRAAVALTVLALVARLGRRRRTERTEPAHPRRVRAAPARAPPRRRRSRAAARRRPARARRGRGRAAERGRAGEGARHRVLHRVQPAVQPRRRRELRGDRHRDAARRDRLRTRVPRCRRRGRARRRAARPAGAGAAAGHAGRGRPPRLGAPGGGGARPRLGGPARHRHAGRLHERRRPRRRRGAGGADRAAGSTRSSPARSPRTASPPRPATGC